MDKLPKKPFPKMPSSISPGVSTSIEPMPNKNMLETISKWVPLICAGSAIGISLFALKEIKNTRRELVNLKKEQYTAPNNDKLEKKMELLEKQLNKITEFLKNTQQQQRYTNPSQQGPNVENVRPRPVSPQPGAKPKQKDPKIVKVNVVPEQVKVINEEPVESQLPDDADEYEEVEVTDDDEPDN
jgi:hypothetical protein